MALTFSTLAAANAARLPTFRNSKGAIAHSKVDGSDWTPAQWLQAVVGELGEYGNVRKKFERGDMGEIEFKEKASRELADVVTYLDILAQRLGIDLGDAVLTKFNEISKRAQSPVFILEDGSDFYTRGQGGDVYTGLAPFGYSCAVCHQNTVDPFKAVRTCASCAPKV